MTQSAGSAVLALAREYKSLQEEPLEGFRVRLLMEDNLFEWEVAIFGPPDTVYHGGYFKALMKFPKEYPFAPPKMRFISEMWHPNVYATGELCISILHTPGTETLSGEHPSERWNPTLTARTVLLSVVSLLNEPNTSSPANVDASVMYRRWKESKGQDKEYEDIIRRLVIAGRREAEKDGVKIPLTLDDYCIKTRVPTPEMDANDFVLDDTDGGMTADDFDYEDDS